MVETSFTPSSILSDSLSDGNVNITWSEIFENIWFTCYYAMPEIFEEVKLTTCSSSVLELSSGIVSGKALSFGDDTHEFYKNFTKSWHSLFFIANKIYVKTYVIVYRSGRSLIRTGN